MYLHYLNSNFNMTGGGMPIPMQIAGAVAAANKAVEDDSATDKMLPYLIGLCVCSCVCTIIGFIANIVITNKQSKDPTNADLASQRNIAFRGFTLCLVCTVCLTASISVMFQQSM